MFPAALSILSELDRPPTYFRALLAILPSLDPIQFRAVSAAEVAAAANMCNASAERALTMLERDNVLITNGKTTVAKRRRLNNRLFWASKATAYPDGGGETVDLDPEVMNARGR